MGGPQGETSRSERVNLKPDANSAQSFETEAFSKNHSNTIIAENPDCSEQTPSIVM